MDKIYTIAEVIKLGYDYLNLDLKKVTGYTVPKLAAQTKYAPQDLRFYLIDKNKWGAFVKIGTPEWIAPPPIPIKRKELLFKK